MKKIKGFLIALTIILVVVTFFSGIALAAQVTRVNKFKGHVFINGGEDAGYILGATVCFVSSSGEELICGTVQRTSASEAMVKVKRSDTRRRRITGGMEALLYGGEEQKEEIKDKEEIKEKEETEKNGKTKKKENWFQ